MGLVVMAGIITNNYPMRWIHALPQPRHVWLLVAISGLMTLGVICNLVPLALIRVIYLASTVAFPLAVVLGIPVCFIPRLRRWHGVISGLILFAPLGFYSTMIWENNDEMCHKAARAGSVEWLNTVLHGGPDVVDTHGNSLLMKAAHYGRTEMVKELLQTTETVMVTQPSPAQRDMGIRSVSRSSAMREPATKPACLGLEGGALFRGNL